MRRSRSWGAALVTAMAASCGVGTLGGCGTSAPPPTRGYAPQELLPLVVPSNPYLARTVMLVAKTGDAATVGAVGDRLVAMALQLVADPTIDDGLRQRTLSEVYSAMVAVPTPAVLNHCRRIVDDLGAAPWHRTMTTAVLVAHADAVPPRSAAAVAPDPEPIVTPPTSAVLITTAAPMGSTSPPPPPGSAAGGDAPPMPPLMAPATSP
ncbi:MAG: hypothetical protein AAF928_06715 [Myxococcota bacterium]